MAPYKTLKIHDLSKLIGQDVIKFLKEQSSIYGDKGYTPKEFCEAMSMAIKTLAETVPEIVDDPD